MDVLIPVNDYIPAWYELSWRKNKLIILIHQAAFEVLKKDFPQEQPVINFYKRDFSLPEFQFPHEGDFGFGPVLKFIGCKRVVWPAWECILPARDEESEQWKRKIFALRATLSLLFQRLQFLDVDTGSEKSQLIVIDDLRVEENSFFSGSLTATLTPLMAQWISRQGNCQLPLVVSAMKSMDRQLIRVSDCGGFKAECMPPKWINFTIPGNSCGLDPKDYYDESLDRGYGLKPHNVDNGIQQLTFLAGLACLHDLARADYHPQ
jgi:hypothetical protein